MKITIVTLCVALFLSACGGEARTATTAPSEPSANDNTTPSAPADTPVPSASTPAAPPADTPGTTPSDTPESTPTPTATAASRPRPTATSSGPLDFQFYIAGCRKAPTADKPGNAIISISIEATGGNGVYRYFYKGIELKTKFFDVEWELGTSINDKATVVSGDGQTLEKEYFFNTTSLECSG